MKDKAIVMKYSWKRLFKELSYWFGVVVIAIALATSLRVFLFASFKIPTPSMEPAILPGDYILVNKQIPGLWVYPHFPKARIDGKVAAMDAHGCCKLTNYLRNSLTKLSVPNIIATFAKYKLFFFVNTQNFTYRNSEKVIFSLLLN